MESFPVDFDVRERVVDGHTFGVRVIPVGKLDALEAPIVQIVAQASLAVRAEMSDDEKREALTKALDPHLAALSEAYAELVRWGIVSMDGRPIATDSETFAGRTFTVLPRAGVDLLMHVGRGSLVAKLASEVRAANTLTVDDLAGFKWPSTQTPR